MNDQMTECGHKTLFWVLFLITAYLEMIRISAITISKDNKTFCGDLAANIFAYCYYINLNPSIETITSKSVSITSTWDGEQSFHYIYTTSIGGACIDPTIDIIFEEIDFSNSSFEYFNVFDRNNDLISKCKGQNDQNCGEWVPCLYQQSLSIPQIAENNTYLITIQGTDELDQLCYNFHDFSLNVILTITCANKPGLSCGPHTWCYYVNLYSVFDNASETVAITSTTNGDETYHKVYITSINSDCFNPTIDVMYEEIDFDSSDEYFDVYDEYNDVLISRCNGTQQNGCGIWGQCLSNRTLPFSIINANETTSITIIGSESLHSMCDDYSLHVKITISCHYKPDPPKSTIATGIR